MPDKALTRLHRVTDLFVNGRELVVADDGVSDPVLLWIKKMNTFELGDAQRDASAARARRIASLSADSDEVMSLRARLSGMTRAAIIDEAASPQRSSAYLGGMDDVRAEPEWNEKLEHLQRYSALEADGSEPTDEERAAIAQINADYSEALEKATEARMDIIVAELDDLDDDELWDKYIEIWRDQVSRTNWQSEFQKSEIYYCTRDCAATRDSNGRYNHTACLHPRLLQSRAAVNELPEELIARLLQVIEDVKMPVNEAGNSDAPSTSSESAELPSKAEESTASTPTET